MLDTVDVDNYWWGKGNNDTNNCAQYKQTKRKNERGTGRHRKTSSYNPEVIETAWDDTTWLVAMES